MDIRTENTLASGLGHLETQPDPATVKSVRDFVSLFVKTIHTLLLYPPTNPLPDQFRIAFYRAAQEILRKEGSLRLATTDRAFYYNGEIVYEDEPLDTNPAYVLFRDGVREIGLLSTLTAAEANAFLDVFVRALSRTGTPVDMANTLWELGMQSIYYCTIDHIADGEVIASLGTTDYKRTSRLFFSTVDLGRPEEKPTEARRGQNPHGYQGIQQDRYQQVFDIFQGEIELGEDEARQIVDILLRDAACDCRAGAFKVLDEILRGETTSHLSRDVVKITRRQFDTILKEGDWPSLPRVLGNIRDWLADFAEQPALADRLREILYHAGDKQVLGRMAEYLNNHPQADLEPFSEYLDYLDSASLGAVTAMLGNLEHHAARKMVYGFLAQRAEEAVDLVGNYVFDKRWFVVRNVALILGRVNHPRAVAFLKKAAAHPDARVRLEAVRSLALQHSPEAGESLLSFLDDPDPNLRIHAIKALTPKPSPAVFTLLERRVSKAELVNLEPRVQKELLAAYARAGGARSLPRLLSVIDKRKLWGKARWKQARIHAVYALGEVGCASAVDALRDVSRRKDPSLSAAAHQVLERLERDTAKEQPAVQEIEQ